MEHNVFRTLYENSGRKHISFHMPGHKGGRKIPGVQKKNLYRIDTTELAYSDDLSAPKGILKKLQYDIASFYGCHRSYLLVNGATSGILCAIYATIKKNEKIIIAGQCHISVINALQISGARPVFARADEFDKQLSYADLVDIIKKNADAKVLFITRPDYFGRCIDIKELIVQAKSMDMKVIVDEAHGTHFIFSDRFPKSALMLGADIIIQSPHKTLPVLTQAGLLLLNDPEVENAITKAFRMFTTTSPSYILIVSVENGFGYMKKHGKIELGKLIEYADGIDGYENIRRQENDDPTRIVLDVTKTGANGYSISRLLADRFGIYIEMADPKRLVLISTVMNTKRDFKKLDRALCRLDKKFEREESIKTEYDYSREGSVSQSNIVVYPPGTPLILKGEIYTKEKIEYMQDIIKMGGEIIEC